MSAPRAAGSLPFGEVERLVEFEVASGTPHRSQRRRTLHAADGTPRPRDGLHSAAIARMCSLMRYLALKKKPPHWSRTLQLRHSGWYSFFQSLIDLTAHG